MAGYIGSKASVVSSGAEHKKTFTITGATTSLTGLNYTVGKVHVFQNGVRLVDGTDYTATNGTTITLTAAAQNGDNVVVISQASYQVALSGIDDQSNAVAMTIDSNENIGIGTSSPSATLDLNVPTGDGLLINSADIATIKMKNTGGGTSSWGFATTNLAASDFGIYQSNSVGGDPITAGTAKMYFNASGNVGIGTSSPDAPLDVTRSGNGTIAVLQNTGNHGFEVSAPSSTTLQIASRQGSKNLDLWANTLSFSAGGSQRMAIDASGRVTMPSQPSFSVSKTGGAVGAGTFVVWNHVEHNVGSHYNTSNGVFTAPVSGVYAVSLNVMDESTSTHVNKQLTMYRNSYVYQRVYGTNDVAGSHGRWTWSGNIQMSANDTLQVLVNNMTIYGNQRDYSNFSGFLVG